MSVQQTIETKLTQAFNPEVLSVENESHSHNVPEGSESHFKVVVVTGEFEGQALIQRHRAVNKTLAEEMQIIHALAIHAFTPQEWQARGETSAASPLCQGGGKK